jgi:L-threonylcarbamoyladenylate synthase
VLRGFGGVKTELVAPSAENISKAADIIKRGGLVAFPTETVYGLGADGLNGEAVRNIFAAKGRPADNPLILHIESADKLTDYARDIPDAAYRLAGIFWPGPLTMVLKKRRHIPDTVTAGLDTVAVRCPGSEIALNLIKASGKPIAAPSANTSGRVSPTSAAHVMEYLNGKIDIIIDGGDCPVGIESTIIDLSEGLPRLLRPGYITAGHIEGVLDISLETAGGASERPKAPGMKYSHYAPIARVIIVDGEPEDVAAYINRQAGEFGVISSSETKSLYKTRIIEDAGSRAHPDEIARGLYAALIRLDNTGVSRIYCEAFYDTELGRSIMNRLEKSAGYNVISLNK